MFFLGAGSRFSPAAAFVDARRTNQFKISSMRSNAYDGVVPPLPSITATRSASLFARRLRPSKWAPVRSRTTYDGYHRQPATKLGGRPSVDLATHNDLPTRDHARHLSFLTYDHLGRLHVAVSLPELPLTGIPPTPPKWGPKTDRGSRTNPRVPLGGRCGGGV